MAAEKMGKIHNFHKRISNLVHKERNTFNTKLTISLLKTHFLQYFSF